MKKLFFIAWFAACITAATGLLPSQTDNSVEKLVHIMFSGNNIKALIPFPHILMERREPNGFQDAYDFVIKNPALLKGIICDGMTFAMLCVRKGYPDLLERLITEGHPVDLATPCDAKLAYEPKTTVLHELFSVCSSIIPRPYYYYQGSYFSEEYIALIPRLTKLIINKYPQLLDIPIDRNKTARQYASFLDLDCLIPRDLRQKPKNLLPTSPLFL